MSNGLPREQLQSCLIELIAARMKCELLSRLSRPLVAKEESALRLAASYIASDDSAASQVALEAYAVERAIELTNGR
jgi:hypothetical protein